MSKAILVMDMPESCSKCMFLYEFSGIKNCNLMNVMYGGASRLSQGSFTKCRHDKCPLCPLLDRREMKYMDDKSEYYRQGWNACIDSISGETKENSLGNRSN